MGLKISISTTSDVPIFQQIAEEIEKLILVSALKEGEFIPSVRDFAVAHAINPNTVSKAYQVLQNQGVVIAVRGKGLIVAKMKFQAIEKRREEMLSEKIRETLKLSNSLGFSKSEFLSIVERKTKESSS